jgi:RHS repeat-associated protein
MFDPYGKVTVLEEDGVTLKAEPVGNPFTFTGRRLDQETGLMQFRFRYYDTGLGRFIGRDPLGYVDGFGLQGAYFVPFDTDPVGLLAAAETSRRIGQDDYELTFDWIPRTQRGFILQSVDVSIKCWGRIDGYEWTTSWLIYNVKVQYQEVFSVQLGGDDTHQWSANELPSSVKSLVCRCLIEKKFSAREYRSIEGVVSPNPAIRDFSDDFNQNNDGYGNMLGSTYSATQKIFGVQKKLNSNAFFFGVTPIGEPIQYWERFRWYLLKTSEFESQSDYTSSLGRVEKLADIPVPSAVPQPQSQPGANPFPLTGFGVRTGRRR